jgi:hypothetical protein
VAHGTSLQISFLLKNLPQKNAIGTRPEINKQSFAARNDLASTKTIQITERSSVKTNGKRRTLTPI